MGHLPSDVAPDLRSRSYTITARVTGGVHGAEGVLLAHEDKTSGYSVCVRDGHLVHDLNSGGSHQTVTSATPVPHDWTGTLGFHMRHNGTTGTGTLLIDANPSGT